MLPEEAKRDGGHANVQMQKGFVKGMTDWGGRVNQESGEGTGGLILSLYFPLEGVQGGRLTTKPHSIKLLIPKTIPTMSQLAVQVSLLYGIDIGKYRGTDPCEPPEWPKQMYEPTPRARQSDPTTDAASSRYQTARAAA